MSEAARTILRIHFEGGFQCRLATDPDPTREGRGVSGYTYALAGESDLDQVIRLQRSEIEDRNFRESNLADACPLSRVGVVVGAVETGDPGGGFKPWAAGEKTLKGAPVRLLDSPTFEMRNQIVSDGLMRIAPPVAPFHLNITAGGQANPVVLDRSDPVDLDDPSRPIWQLAPDAYARRIPVYNRPSDEVQLAIDVPDVMAYFEDRRTWLEAKLWEAERAGNTIGAENFRTRLYTINNHGQPGAPGEIGFIQNRLALECLWDHTVRGVDMTVKGEERLGGKIPRQPGTNPPGDYWRVRFWMGGWDGDLMRGYLKGWLDVPFVPAA
jgi:hypothetical protein